MPPEAAGPTEGRPYLLIVRAGDNSLHRHWFEGGAGRNWDLHVSYYGKKADPFGPLPDAVSLSREPGPKFIGAADYLEAHPHVFRRYRYIGLPDDDLLATAAVWNRAFALIEQASAVLGQPSVSHDSYYSHPHVLQRPGLMAREVGFIEQMAPLFEAGFLKRALPSLRANYSSWGIAHLWAAQARTEQSRCLIIDEVAIRHTRPVGRGELYTLPDGTRIDPRTDLRTLLKQYRLKRRREGTKALLTRGGVWQRAVVACLGSDTLAAWRALNAGTFRRKGLRR